MIPKDLGACVLFLYVKVQGQCLERQYKYERKNKSMGNKNRTACTQGVDGCTFEVKSKSLFKPMRDISLKSPTGNEFGVLRTRGIEYELFICPSKYIRKMNERPFGISDLSHIDDMRREIESVLKKVFPRGYYIEAKKIEVNMTDTMVGNCRCKNLFGLLCDSMLHGKDQNILYVTQSKDSLIEKEIPGYVSRTVGNQWKLKCYDKQKQLEVEMGVQITEPLIRMEFILLSRKIDKLFGKQNDLSNVFSVKGVSLLLEEYKSLMENLIDNYVKRYLSDVHNQLLNDLKRFKSPTDVYCLRKELIHDKVQLQKALRAMYREENREDISSQVLYGLNQKYGLPCDTLKTLRKFHSQC